MIEHIVFEAAAVELLSELRSRPSTVLPAILPVDTWLARSIFQKALRRGLTNLALSAGWTLLRQDRRAFWRRFVITLLEDFGVCGVDLLLSTVATIRSDQLRRAVGEWTLAEELIRRTESLFRCQAANDLWNVALHDPGLDDARIWAGDAALPDVQAAIGSRQHSLGERAMLGLVASGMHPAIHRSGEIFRADPEAIVHASGIARSGVSAALSEAAKMTRVPLAGMVALLLPESPVLQLIAMDPDEFPEASWRNSVPLFALDQYVRAGKAAISSFVRQSSRWKSYVGSVGYEGNQPAAAGELLFRAEGALVANRSGWATARMLRSTSLRLGAFVPTTAVDEGIALIRSELPLIDTLRASHLPT